MVKLSPSIVIFDVDGVLVDVRRSYLRSILQTVRHFTGRRITYADVHRWKNRSGFNDDWRLSTAWVASLGRPVPYELVKAKFRELYCGRGRNAPGNVANERWLVPRARLEQWSNRAELAIFTGRIRAELQHTLEHFRVAKYFAKIVTVEDVRHPKPHPEGLRKILAARDPRSAVYLGDNIDDALAARRARIPFVGVLPAGSLARRHRAAALRRASAVALLSSVLHFDNLFR
jgi:HAD superfamily phosphatase